MILEENGALAIGCAIYESLGAGYTLPQVGQCLGRGDSIKLNGARTNVHYIELEDYAELLLFLGYIAQYVCDLRCVRELTNGYSVVLD